MARAIGTPAYQIRLGSLAVASDLERVAIEQHDEEIFGSISAAVPRSVSHNDRWIIAAAASGGHRLVTQDSELMAAVEQRTFRTRRGLEHTVEIILCARRR